MHVVGRLSLRAKAKAVCIFVSQEWIGGHRKKPRVVLFHEGSKARKGKRNV